MTVIETAPTPTGQPGRRRWIVPAAVAAAVAVLVVAALVVAARDEAPEVPAAPTMTTVQEPAAADPAPQSVAEAFVEAVGASDVEATDALLAPDADRSGLGDGTDSWQREFLLREAQGHQLLVESCEPTGTNGDTTTVSCAIAFHDLRSEELGRGPFTGSQFEVTVRDGMVIAAMIRIEVTSGYTEQVWEPFRAWMESTHPDDLDIMYTEDPLVQYSDESIQLWEQRTREYVQLRVSAETAATAFLNALGAFDVEAAGNHLAAGADTSSLVPVPASDYQQAIAWLRALGYEQTLGQCEQSDVVPSGLQFDCPFEYHLVRSGEMGLDPFEGGHFFLTVVNGEIVDASANWNEAKFLEQVWTPFVDFFATTYPDDVALMIDAEQNPLLTAQSLALWEQHSRDYGAHVMESTPPTTTP